MENVSRKLKGRCVTSGLLASLLAERWSALSARLAGRQVAVHRPLLLSTEMTRGGFK